MIGAVLLVGMADDLIQLPTLPQIRGNTTRRGKDFLLVAGNNRTAVQGCQIGRREPGGVLRISQLAVDEAFVVERLDEKLFQLRVARVATQHLHPRPFRRTVQCRRISPKVSFAPSHD